MVKRFEKGKIYTLCLINDYGDTFTVNAIYKTRIGKVLEFGDMIDGYFTIDLDTKLVVQVTYEYITLSRMESLNLYNDTDTHIEQIERYHFYHVCNITKEFTH